jgi:predicted metalloprotease with PDZ domain
MSLRDIACGASLCLFVLHGRAQPTSTSIQIVADLTDAPRKLYHAEVELPVKAGPLTLTTPEWIPGNHRPNGPVENITGLVFTANGETIPWRRDDVNLYSFHLTIPKGVTSLHAHLDCIATSRNSTKMAVLEWERLLLYPAGVPVKDIAIQPSVTVPSGWGIGTALTPAPANTAPSVSSVSTTMRYAPTTVEQLQDSPVITGQYFKEFPLAPELSPTHYIDVVADEEADANLRPEFIAQLSNLVREARSMYGSRHYNVYHFLLTLSDAAGGEGLEHGQSSDNGVGEKAYSDAAHQIGDADLLAHEFTHSWNGKYRRPARLYQPDFATPQQGDLLWVYEGLTQYLGNVLATRAGLKNQEQYRDLLAISAASLDSRPGREWRSTEDSAISSSILRETTAAWANWRRGQDYYQDGELVWLDADTVLRKLTNDKRSLDDFTRAFLGKGGDTGPEVVPYELPEIVATLNQIAPYDWAKFFHDRIVAVNAHADLQGVERGGYKLVFTDKPNKTETALAGTGGRRGPNVWYSLGIRLNADGTITDVRREGPADTAKLTPGQKIIAVNGIVFSADALKSAIRSGKDKPEPIHFILQTNQFITQADIQYHDGERFPALVRVEDAPDYLDEITKPHASAPEHASAAR